MMYPFRKNLKGEKEVLIIFLKDISVEWYRDCQSLFQGLKKYIVKSEIHTVPLRLLSVKG